MRLVLVIAFAALILNGGKSKAEGNTHKIHQTDSAAGRKIVAVDEQTPSGKNYNHPKNPPSYLCRLLSSENISNVVLALVGIIGIIIAICTLRAINTQTIDTGTAANAALLNARAVINAERPWLVVSVERVDYCHFSIKAKNVGRTPARLISIQGDVVLIDQGNQPPEAPHYGMEKHLRIHPRLFPPTETRMIDESFTSAFAEELNQQIVSGLRRMFLVGKIVYSDALPAVSNNKARYHETRWCYMLATVDGPVIPEFCPPEYSEYT